MRFRTTPSVIATGSMAASSRADCAPWASGTSLRTSLALAEWLCRTADRIDPARVLGPRHCLRRGTFAPNSEILRRLLQLRQNASVFAQGRAGFSACSAIRHHNFKRPPWRTSLPILPGLGFRHTQAYAKAGYVLVRVILPPQQLVNGARLKLVVVDGFIERIETKDVPERVRNRIITLVGPLTGRRTLMLSEIERRVLLAGDTPGVVLRSTLSPGKAERGTILVIDATYQAVSETLTFDNTLSRQLGRTTLGAGLDFNSITGLGELVYLRASGHPNDGDNGFSERYPRNRTLAAGFILPLWVDGLTFNAEYTDAHTTPVAGAGVHTTHAFDPPSPRLRHVLLPRPHAHLHNQGSFYPPNQKQNLVV